MQYVEGLLSTDLSLRTECTSTDRSQSLCILRACLRTPSVETYRFMQPGKAHRYRAFAGTTGLCFMRAWGWCRWLLSKRESELRSNAEPETARENTYFWVVTIEISRVTAYADYGNSDDSRLLPIPRHARFPRFREEESERKGFSGYPRLLGGPFAREV